MKKLTVIAASLISLSCITPPKLSIDDPGFLVRDTVIAVVSSSDNMKGILAADQLRNYLAVNGSWKVLTKAFTEKACFDREFPLSQESVDSPSVFTDNGSAVEADLKKLMSLKDISYVIVCMPRSVTTTSTYSGRGGGRSSESLDINFDVTIIASSSGKVVSRFNSSGTATAFSSGGFLSYISDKNKASIVAVDKFIQNYARQAVELQRNAR